MPEAGFELVALAARPVIGRGPRRARRRARRARARARSLRGARAARARRRRRDLGRRLRLGAGVLAAALLRRIPIALRRAQRACPGAREPLARALRARASSSSSRPRAPRSPATRPTRASGSPALPLRARARRRVPRRAAAARAPEPPCRLFVFGGSQGARQINDAMLAAAAARSTRARFEIVHQTGEADRERVAAAYARGRRRRPRSSRSSATWPRATPGPTSSCAAPAR